ncbi:MAG TPA: hypothetical protein VIB38_14250 [Aestuariivirgaceae bacterium]
MWNNFGDALVGLQYGSPMFGSLAPIHQKLNSTTALTYGDTSPEEGLLARSRNGLNPSDDMHADVLGKMRNHALLQFGGNRLANSRKSFPEAVGSAITGLADSGYPQLQRNNAWQEMEDRRRLRENKTWEVIDQDTGAQPQAFKATPDRINTWTIPLADLSYIVGIVGVASVAKPYRKLGRHKFRGWERQAVESWEEQLLAVPLPALRGDYFMEALPPTAPGNRRIH